jgi:accessory colonization factor AcfA
MKNNLCLVALILSSSAFAAPYVGLEYGVTSMDSKYTTNFTGDAVSLNPNEASDSFGGFIGYRFDSVGLELGYKQYDADDSRSQHKGFTGSYPNQIEIEQEREWNADVNAKQLTFKPVYFYNVSEKLQLKTGLGLTYTQYKFDSSANTEYENDLTDHEYTQDNTAGNSKSESVFGGIASVGIEYMVIPNLALGASASYQVDNIANSSSFMLSSAYYF